MMNALIIILSIVVAVWTGWLAWEFYRAPEVPNEDVPELPAVAVGSQRGAWYVWEEDE